MLLDEDGDAGVEFDAAAKGREGAVEKITEGVAAESAAGELLNQRDDVADVAVVVLGFAHSRINGNDTPL